MKLIQINTVCNGSTGKIMGEIQKAANDAGYETISFYGRRKGFSDLKCEKIGGFFSFWFHVALTTIFDIQGHGSYFKTKKLVKRLREESPDIIHLHNIHGYYLNYDVLFKYLKEEFKGKIFWTFHDCWPFTGHCPYFTAAGCDKWKTQCEHCPNKKRYPISLFKDNSYHNYQEKRELFNDLKNLTIITPSKWLQGLVEKSFLKSYKVFTIENGINLDIFSYRKDDMIYDKYGIPKNKSILLGVASIWEERKGLKDFVELSKQVDERYCIVLVGINNKQKKMLLPYKNIICIPRTENQQELAILYSISQFFINPTYEDNYPTVNIEALACGTKIIAYDTGGCIEQAEKNENMTVIQKGIFESNINKIVSALETEKNSSLKSDVSIYDSRLASKRILELYRRK